MKTRKENAYFSEERYSFVSTYQDTRNNGYKIELLFMLTNSISKIVSTSNIEAVNELVISDVWKINVEDIFLVIMKK